MTNELAKGDIDPVPALIFTLLIGGPTLLWIIPNHKAQVEIDNLTTVPLEIAFKGTPGEVEETATAYIAANQEEISRLERESQRSTLIVMSGLYLFFLWVFLVLAPALTGFPIYVNIIITSAVGIYLFFTEFSDEI